MTTETNDESLQAMWSMQRDFMGVLVDKGKLPPVFEIEMDYSSKESQAFLRELGQFFLIELAEAYEQYEYLLENLRELQNNIGEFHKQLQVFNEELADCTAFIIEIWIYLGITKGDIKSTLVSEDESRRENPNPLRQMEDLEALMMVMKDRNISWGFYALNSAQNTFPLLPNTEFSYRYEAGRRLHVSNKTIAQSLNWEVTYKTLKSLNLLKNKPWREGGIDLDLIGLRKEFIELGLNFFQLADFYGAKKESIFHNYKEKYEKNLERQNEGY
jgi:hypothetical protein